MATDTEAVEGLTALGLTEYEAKCFVALSQLSQGTAKEVSRVGEVPQSRVYDVMEELHRGGLVDIEESDPRRYFAIPVERAIDRLRREYTTHLESAATALQNLNAREHDDDGVWMVASQEDVINRVRMLVDDAREVVHLHVAHEDLLDADQIDALEDCVVRGVTIYVEVPSAELCSEIHDAIPTAYVAVSDLPLGEVTMDGRAPGRLVMVDREVVLLSALKEGLVPDEVDETGVWASDGGHGLIAWLRPFLNQRIEQQDFSTAE